MTGLADGCARVGARVGARSCGSEEVAAAGCAAGVTGAMIQFTGTEWDEFGRLVAAVGLMAMLAYLLPAMMSLSPQWERRTQFAAIGLLTAALVLAAIASVAWVLR